MAVVSCPSCQFPLPSAAARCPRCESAVPSATEDRTRTLGPAVVEEPDDETLTHQPPAGADQPSGADFLAPPQRPDEIGRLGPYRVLARVGAGGMGIVFRAEDPAIGRAVALKVMLPEFATNPAWRARFVREARAAAAVEHENVVQVYDVGESGGVAYLVMPLLNGQTLGRALKQNRQPPLKEALRIGREVALGLAAAHKVGLVHRDIKPANLWLSEMRNAECGIRNEDQNRDSRHSEFRTPHSAFGRVKILDFGLARAFAADGAAADGPTITAGGAVVGTPAYMSPEQAKGEKDWRGFAVTVSHTGAVRLRGRGEAVDQRLDRTVEHKAVKKQGEWNTMRIVVRGDSFDLYANGEEIASGVRHWGGSNDTCAVGVAGVGAEVEYERITIWDLSPPKT